jgi:uncharacterized membrane protein YsdA (DUF1294 family)
MDALSISCIAGFFGAFLVCFIFKPHKSDNPSYFPTVWFVSFLVLSFVVYHLLH